MDPVASAIAAGRVPEGVAADYLYQSRDNSAIAGILFVCCLTTVVVALRCFSRGYVVKHFGSDDAVAALGLVRNTLLLLQPS